MPSFYVDVAIKLTIGLLSLAVVINISGKGNLAPTSASDQIQNYVLGGIIGGVIYNTSISIITFLIFILIWSLVVIIVKLLINIKAVKSLVVGNPVILIKNGKVNVANCAKVGISADQLMLHIRMEGLFSTKEVKSAIMETNGKLTIIDMQSATPKFPIISNGKINRDILEVIGHDEKWLLSSINEQGIENIQDIFLGEYVNGELNLTTYPKIA